MTKALGALALACVVVVAGAEDRVPLEIRGLQFPRDSDSATLVILGQVGGYTQKMAQAMAESHRDDRAGAVLVVVPKGDGEKMDSGHWPHGMALAEINQEDWADALKRYGFTGVPALIVTDTLGRVVETFTGMQDAATLWEKLHRLQTDPGGRAGGYGSGRMITLTSSGQVKLTNERGPANLGFGARVGDRPSAMIQDPSGFVYVACTGSGTVVKLRPGGQTDRTFRVGREPMDLAIDPKGRLWVTLSGDDAVCQFTALGEILGTYKVGKRPAGICLAGNRLYVANAGDGTVSVLTLDGQVVGNFPVGKEPWSLFVRSDPGVHPGPYVYVSLAGEDKVGKFTLSGEKIPSSYGYPTAHGPRGILPLPDGRLLVACGEGKVTCMSQDGQSLSTLDADPGACRILFVPERSKPPSGDDVILLDQSTGAPAGKVPAPVDGKLWVTCQEEGTVVLLHLAGERVGSYRVGRGPRGILQNGEDILVAVERGPEVGVDVNESGWTLKDRRASRREGATEEGRREDEELSRKELEGISETDRQAAVQLQQKGSQAFSKGDLQGAIEDYSQAIHQDPTNWAAYAGRADARAWSGASGDAVADYRRAISRTPGGLDDANVLRPQLVELLIAGGSLDEAEGELKRLPSSGAGAAWTELLYGQYYLMRSAADTAVEHLGRARALDPNLAKVAYDKASHLLQYKQWNRALLFYSALETMEGESAGVFFGKGKAYAALGRRDDAIQAYQRFLQLDHDSAWAREARAALEELRR